MLRIPYLRNILILAVLLAVGLPLYALLVINPAYRQLITEETEGEAVRYVNTLVRNLDIELDTNSLEPGHLPAKLVDEVRLLQGDLTLVKLRVFSAHGEIVLSTEASEVGTRNTKPYFVEQVASGRTYSKVVSKGEKTAEGNILERTVVETYVPLMHQGMFLGAIETYFDITIGREKIDRLAMRTTILLFAVATGMLFFIVLALHTAHDSIHERDAAEAALRQSNQDLEARVAARTEEILDNNRLLVEEITVRRRTEETLERTLADVEHARARTDALLRSIPDGLLVVDARQRLLLCNPTAAEVLDLPADAVGRPLRELLPAGAPLFAALESPSNGPSMEFERSGESGRRVFQARTSLLGEAEGAPGGCIMLLHDVSTERAAAQDKRDFITMAAHELHAPLSAVLGYADLLSSTDDEGLLPSQRREILTCVAEQAQVLKRLVDDLLDASRVESGQSLALQRSLCRIGEVLQAALTAARADGRFRFELDVADGDTQLKADRGRLQQVLANLLGNAVKFSPPGGVIRISGARDSDGYRVCVSDQGRGMTEEEQKKAFDKFFRGPAAGPGTRSTGLGLAICRAIVEAHGGRIAIESQPGAGTQVCFTLPVNGDA